MPEQQASPSSRPPSALSTSGQKQSQDDSVPSPPESVKRTYLSLLPPPQLIDLILTIDANRQTVIFPHDLESAIKALQRPQRQPSPVPNGIPAVSVVVKAEPLSTSLPLPLLPHPLPPHSQQQSQTPPHQTQPQPNSPPVQPPQYRPPQAHPGIYPYTHTPYYPPPPPQPPPPTHVPPPAAPVRHPLFTSAPLQRDPNKPPAAHPTPPPPVSSRDDPNAMPSYEEMIVEAIMDVGDGEGTAPKVLFAWMASHYPLQQNFRPSASQALHKALKRGRLEKVGGKYRLNPLWGGGPTTSKRATRRPTANRALSPHPHGQPAGSPSAPPSAYTHPPPYGYAPYGHHPSLPPHPQGHMHPYHHPYGPNGWVPQTVGQAINGMGAGADVLNKAEGPEEDEGVESEEMEGQELSEVKEVLEDERKREEIRRSLQRLARVLKRVAKRSRIEGATGMPVIATVV